MIMTVAEIRQFIETDKDDIVIQVLIDGIESLILQYTHNDFKSRLTGEVEYPPSVKMAVVDMVRWKLQNMDQNSNDVTQKPIQSETISRHSVTYASDSTESDIDSRFGVPKKYTSVFKLYEKARF